MVTKTMTINRTCIEGHRWKQEMTITQIREMLQSKTYSMDCPECPYPDVNMLPSKKLQQILSNESH